MNHTYQPEERVYLKDYDAYAAWYRSTFPSFGLILTPEHELIADTGEIVIDGNDEGIYCTTNTGLGALIPVRFLLPSNQPHVTVIENAVVQGARYIPYVHKPIVRQPWQRAMIEADGCATLEEALETALYWMNNPSYWVNAMAVRRSDGVLVAWTEASLLPALFNQIAKNDVEPPR